ncbi:MAG: hypothetical protein QW837_09380 [Conexivisphaerales archaeon]
MLLEAVLLDDICAAVESDGEYPASEREVLSLLLSDRKMRDKLGSAARDHIKKNYLSEIISRKMIEFYERLE